MIEGAPFKYELSSELSLNSLTYDSCKNEEEEEENNEDNDDLSSSNQPISHLHCHPNDPLPSVAISMCCQLSHPECNRCYQCSKQITKGKAFLRQISQNKEMKMLCMNCAQQIDKNRKTCHVCQEDIKDEEISNKKEKKNKAVELRKGVFIHKDCLHCQICGFSKGKSYQCLRNKNKTKTYVICLECATLMNGGTISRNINPFVGRFIEEILPSNFSNQCQQCNQPLICNGFVFADQKILCANCGISFFHNKKKNHKF